MSPKGRPEGESLPPGGTARSAKGTPPTTAAVELTLEGRCWKLGDDVPNDGGLMPIRFVAEQEYRPEVLAQHSLVELLPEFTREAKPGDILVAGRNFAFGNPHVQGLLGLRGKGVGVIVGSIPRGAFRAAINAGVPVISRSPDVVRHVESGHRLRVEFATGLVHNLTTGESIRAEPMSPFLLEIVAHGGGTGYLKHLLQQS